MGSHLTRRNEEEVNWVSHSHLDGLMALKVKLV